MNYLTLSGAVDTDPLFDPRSLRPGYHDWHAVEVDLEDRQPIAGAEFTVSYRAFVRYTDAGDLTVDRVELLMRRTAEQYRRGAPALSRPFGCLFDDRALHTILLNDARSETGLVEVRSVVEQHQADRDEDLAAAHGCEP